MANMSKPIPADPKLERLLEEAKAGPVDARQQAISAMLKARPDLSRDYVTGFVDAQLQEPHLAHEVAETIARAIETDVGPKARREALNWAASVARATYPAPEAEGS